MFFVGLVPYLPDFGGYIRASGGVLLSALACFYMARELKRLLDRRAQELTASQDERARRVVLADGVKAFLGHHCPACETNFSEVHARPDGKKPEAPGFCAACGLMLFQKCRDCGVEGFAHLPHCTACGSGMQVARGEVLPAQA
jgi:hypothetical protein